MTATATNGATSLRPDRNRDLPGWAWIGIPVVSIVFLLITPLLGYDRWQRVVMGEFGALEWGTVALLVPAMVFSVLIFRRRRELPDHVGWLMLLGGLAAFYFAGEELSWGQHILGYETPEAIAAVNSQNEFNFHNSHPIFNNLPRSLMLAACLVGGVILPFVRADRRCRPEARQRFWYWIIPTLRLVPIALIAVVCSLPGKFFEDWSLENRDTYASMAFLEPGGEYKEFAFAAVILLYLWSVHRRLGAATPPVDR